MRGVLTALAVVAVVALGGCGGGDETASTAGGDSGSATDGGSADQAPEAGSKAAAPGVPTSREGDNSIQTWGVETGGEKRQEAIADVRAYLDARAAREWDVVCSHLAPKARQEYVRIGKGSCARGMEAFFGEAPEQALREETEIDVLSFRAGGDFGFLIYERPDGKVYATAVEPKGGGWKLISVTPQPLS